MTIFLGVFKAGANHEYVMVIFYQAAGFPSPKCSPIHLWLRHKEKSPEALNNSIAFFNFCFAFFAFYFVDVLVLFVTASFKSPTNQVTILVENKFCLVQLFSTMPTVVTRE